MKYIDKDYVNNIINLYDSGKIISRRKNIFYNGLEKTLNNNVYYVLNNEEKTEYAKCYSDPIYFIEKYLNIKLRKYQIEWVKHYKENRFQLFNVARQTGYNTIIAALNLHDMIFFNKNILLFCIKYDTAIEVINLIKLYYFKLPYFLKPNIIKIDKKNIFFNNSKISVFTNTITNYDIYQYINFAYMSNVQYNFYHNEIIPKIMLNTETKLIISSTPNGKNYFYELYKNSILPKDHPEKNIFNTIQTYWYEVDGRDENWKLQQIKMLGSIEKFNQEYNLEF